MKKEYRNFLISAGFLLLTGIYVFIAKNANSWFFSFYPQLSQYILKVLSIFTSVVPFSLWEIILAIIIGILIYKLVLAIRSKVILLWLSKVVLVICVVTHLFVSIWGLNYYSPTLFERLEIDNRAYSAQELAEVTTYFLQKANYYSDLVERDENKEMVVDFKETANRVADGYQKLSQKIDFFVENNVSAKKLVSSRYFALSGTTGIFICITGESNVCTTTYNTALPLTIAHEIAHRSSIAREDEANFIGFLCCINIDDPSFQYSAYYEAFIYCYNALYKTDLELFEEVRSQIGELVRYDINCAREHYNRLENKKITQVSNDIYDDYLSSFGIEGGVRTYSEVVQLLLGWYFS